MTAADNQRALILLVAVAYCIAAAGTLVAQANASESDQERRRAAMVEQQIVARGISDPSVLKAVRETPRHRFVPPEMEAYAHEDNPLPIGYGQTISQPYIVAYMSQLLDVKRAHKVLEIGTGSGYQAAVLAKLAGKVYSIEIVEPLGLRARDVLREMGLDNVEVRIGDGYAGWAEHAPFDRILLTAAPEEIPQALLDQLAPGGRLVAPVGPVRGDQEIVVIDKDRRGRLKRKRDLPVRFVPMVKGEP
jgi:protein-L-isoaspartate(D-aspartate) O-methyltransferase